MTDATEHSAAGEADATPDHMAGGSDATRNRVEPWQALCEAIREVNSWTDFNGGTPEYAQEVLNRLRREGWDVR